MELTLDQALQKGVEAHKAGKVQEADQYYTAILKTQPKHPDANHNMGVLAVGVGKVQEALPFFKTALEANPSIAQFWFSYIDALIQLNRMDDAKAVFDQAKSHGAKGDGFDQIEKRLNSGVNITSKTQEPSQDQLQPLIDLYTNALYEEALTEAKKLLITFPNSINLYNIIGAANQNLSKLDEAIQAYQKALSINPDFAQALNNMGNTLKDQGKLEEALEAFQKALSINPDYAEALNNMGTVLKQQGKPNEAIKAYKKALSIKPDLFDLYNNICIILKGIIFNKPDRDLQKIIISILEKKSFVRPSDITKAAISLIKSEPTLKKHLQLYVTGVIKNPLDVISDLNELPLLLKLMGICPLPDLELEGLLTNLRFAILSNISSLKEVSSKSIAFQSALALQCFTNEYIYHHTEEETKALQALEKTAKNAFKNDKQPNPQVVLALASYKALNQYDWCELLVITDDIQEVFSRQVVEPNYEEKLKKQLPILKEITDNVSSQVRAQYEENPYPRWVNLRLSFKPKSISEVVNQINLKLYDKKITDVKKPEILYAGCGTGQHSIETSTRFKSSNLLAIDLSLSSLAYATRKTEELAIENIEYMQGDVLDLSQLNRQFDIIKSAGVLHHMENPMAGWKVLAKCLKPGGLMMIGLYSELARQHIVKMRREISEAGIGSSAEEMKSYRTKVITSHQNHHKKILNSSDFYSLSELKDLLFHIQEHRFTITQIKDCLDKLGLKFCGFEQMEIVSHFKKINTNKGDPYDLDKWQAYEKANPRTFTGMYQFWCQKVD